MPRGDNPNSRANLIKNSDLTPEERRAKASMMGKASGEARRRLKSFRELDDEHTSEDERNEMLLNLKERAKSSDVAFALYRDTVGLKPIEKIQVAEVDQATIEDIESIFNG